MNFLLKIVEGPNKGAEIALVDGVAVTLGKGDDCDIVLADSTLPPSATTIEASGDGVAVDGETLEPFTVKSLGATSFAVGPADAPWSELKWPKKEEREEESGVREEAPVPPNNPTPEPPNNPTNEPSRRRRGGCCGCIVALALVVLVLAGLIWFFRAAIEDFCGKKGYDVSAVYSRFRQADLPGKAEKPTVVEKLTLAVVAARHGLKVEEGDGQVKVTGNLKTRAERLRATAEAYEAKPGVELDLSDDESFKAAAEGALFTITEGALKVASATNRVLSIYGVSGSPESLRMALEALSADLPKLRNVDVAGVKFGVVPRHATTVGGSEYAQPGAPAAPRTAPKKASQSLPVCGILTKPYPCLVMRDGSRVMEGAALGGNVILRIDADEVTVTNSVGKFVWRP
jgi:hypothetical protein